MDGLGQNNLIDHVFSRKSSKKKLKRSKVSKSSEVLFETTFSRRNIDKCLDRIVVFLNI